MSGISCGNTVPAVDTYSPMKSSDGVYYIGYDFKLKGRHYRKIQTAENKQVVFCPICKNHEFSDDAQNCSICGTPLYNRCTQDDTVLDGSCRYCPDCGTEALFKEVYNTLPEPVNADSVPIDFDDFIEYQYWDYIQWCIGYKEKNMDLYVALDGSLAYRDGVDFVVLVTDKRDQELVNVSVDVIIRCLQDYGYVTIENVKCFNVSR